MPTAHEAEKQHTGPEEAEQPPSMSSHVAAPAAPSRNPCCLCWCCCCSCSWSEGRRRAWQASAESKLQPLPSCEACAPPSPEEARSWAQSFDKLMHSPAGRSAFRAFLRTEYSEENLLFWLACEELKAEANQHVVDEKARLIYEDYVSILSPKEVSLDSRVREGINKKMQEPSAHTFDDAQLQIYTLMHRDSYPRFLSSPAYRALLLQGTPSPPLRPRLPFARAQSQVTFPTCGSQCQAHWAQHTGGHTKQGSKHKASQGPPPPRDPVP